MEESTTASLRISGQRRPVNQPALRRLARACISLARWQRTQATTDVSSDGEASSPRPEASA